MTREMLTHNIRLIRYCPSVIDDRGLHNLRSIGRRWISSSLCSALRVSCLITTVGAADSGKPLFQIPAFEEGTDRFADDGPEKTKPLLEFPIVHILKRLVTTTEDLP